MLNNTKLDPLNCRLTQSGKTDVYVGISGWVSASGVRYGNQQILCGTVESFKVNVTKVHPPYIMRDYTNQDLHLYGSDF